VARSCSRYESDKSRSLHLAASPRFIAPFARSGEGKGRGKRESVEGPATTRARSRLRSLSDAACTRAYRYPTSGLSYPRSPAARNLCVSRSWREEEDPVSQEGRESRRGRNTPVDFEAPRPCREETGELALSVSLPPRPFPFAVSPCDGRIIGLTLAAGSEGATECA